MASLKQVGFEILRVYTYQRLNVSTQRVDLTDGSDKGGFLILNLSKVVFDCKVDQHVFCLHQMNTELTQCVTG